MNGANQLQIIKQQNRDGCIAACAASVLRYHQIPGNWTEAGIIAYLNEPGPSGFQKLRNYLRRQPDFAGWDALIVDVGARNLQDMEGDGTWDYMPWLMHVQPAHCVVIAYPDQTGAALFDPGQNQQDRQQLTWANIQARCGGSLLYVRRTP
jgi:hypothetical protein